MVEERLAGSCLEGGKYSADVRMGSARQVRTKYSKHGSRSRNRRAGWALQQQR